MAVGLDRVTDLVQEGLRRQDRGGSLPSAALLGSALEIFYRHRTSKLTLALARAQLALGVLVHLILPSRPAAKLVERGLSRQGERTSRGLTRLMGIVRATRLLHRGDWSLNLASTELRSLALDGTGSRLFEGATFAGAELEDVDLLGMFASADFSHAEARRCSFLGCALRWASFRGAKLEDVVLLSSQASRCDFNGAELARCTLSGVTLSGSSFEGATVRDVVFEQCDLAGVVIGESTWENVDLVGCANVDEALAALEQVNVIAAEDGAETPARTTLGATPRGLVTTAASGDARARVIVRYAGASSTSRPPLGYRVETAARLLSVWIALGSDYREARRRWRSADAPALTDVFPRNRALFVLKVLAGSVRFSDQDHLAAVVYGPLTKVFEKRYPGLEEIPLPELIFVDGDRPVARYVDMGGSAYIVMSTGLQVMTIRLARYCVGWLRPEAVGYMDEPPAEAEPDQMRDVLRRGLEWFARSGEGDIAGVGRIQLTGLRHTQATYVTLTFLAFTLAHELAHFLHSRGLVDLSGGAWGDEVEADILAARVIGEEGELDGDALLVEAVKDSDASEVRRVLRLMQRETDDEEFGQLDVDGLTDEELEGFAEEMAPTVTRFAESNWHATAVAALILILGGSVGYDGDEDLNRRLTTVLRAAFGEDVLAAVEREMATEGSVLHLLDEIFSPPASRS